MIKIKKIHISVLLIMLLILSCTRESRDHLPYLDSSISSDNCEEAVYKLTASINKTEKERDALKLANDEYMQYIALLNHVDETLQNMISSNQISLELDIYDNEERVKQNLDALESKLGEFQTKISSVELALRNKQFSINKLEQEKQTQITQITDLRIKIKEKQNKIKELTENLEEAHNKIDKQEKVIKDLSKKYVVFMTKKSSGIKEVIGSKIPIPCKVKKVEITSEHPIDSYKFIDEDPSGIGESSLVIINPSSFWQKGGVLVLQLNTRNNLY